MIEAIFSIGENMPNIGVKRTMPGVAGITPKDFDNLLGVVSDKKYDVDDIISIKNLR